MSNFIESILSKHKISEYLANKGIHSVGSVSGNKLKYHCPLHKGDNDPSFYLYQDSVYENYFCFGCSQGGNFINLYMALEGVSKKDAFKKLLEGVQFDPQTLLKEIAQKVENGNETFVDPLPRILLEINRSCYDYLSLVSFDIQEMEFIQKIMQIVDKVFHKHDIEELKHINDFVILLGLPSRYKKYICRQDEDIKDKVIWESMGLNERDIL